MTSEQTNQARALSYRTIDLVTIATLGVAFGVIYWGWNNTYNPASEALGLIYPPAKALIYGVWILGGVVGGLIVRKPGAALATELIAAAVSTFILGGTPWGLTVLASGFIEGIGVELVLACFLYRRFNIVVAALAGALAGAAEALYEWTAWIPEWSMDHKILYLAFFAASGAAIAGAGGWLIVRALAKTGVLDAFEPGRESVTEI